MMRLLRRAIARARREDGTAAFEMAISCTVLMAMLFGVCEMSIAMYDGHFTSEAARQATRWASVRGSASCANTPNISHCSASATDIQTYVQNLGYPGIIWSNVTVTTKWCAASTTYPTTWSTCTAGTANLPKNMVQVTVGYPFGFHVPFSSNLSFNLSSTSEMVISQ